MPINQITSRSTPAGVLASPANTETLSMQLPIRADEGQIQARAEEHVLEISPSGSPSFTITVALRIDPRHAGEAIAPARPTATVRREIEGGRDMAGGIPQWEKFTPRAKLWVLSQLEEFLQMFPKWGEISLLRAAELDARFFVRVRADHGFTTGVVDKLTDAMNRAARGELDPEPFRNLGKRRAGSTPRKDPPNATATRQRKRRA